MADIQTKKRKKEIPPTVLIWIWSSLAKIFEVPVVERWVMVDVWVSMKSTGDLLHPFVWVSDWFGLIMERCFYNWMSWSIWSPSHYEHRSLRTSVRTSVVSSCHIRSHFPISIAAAPSHPAASLWMQTFCSKYHRDERRVRTNVRARDLSCQCQAEWKPSKDCCNY